MAKYMRKMLRPALFILGGAAVGAIYYYLVGCQGSCPISSSLWLTMAYTGVIGWLLSGITKKSERK